MSSVFARVLPRLRCCSSSRYLIGLSTKYGNKRWLSSASELVHVERDPVNRGIVTIKMNNKPANTCSTELNLALISTIKDLEADEQNRGLIVTSAIPNIFNAGLELTNLYGKSYSEVKEYFGIFQKMANALFTTRLATVAAVNGHALAGGCVISLCCEYRIMADGKYGNGLNEVVVGLSMPTWVSAYTVYALGTQTAERAILSGKRYTPREALQIGLVDLVVPGEEIMQVSRDILTDWIKIPELPRRVTKERLRKETADVLMSDPDKHAGLFAEGTMREEFQIGLGKYLEGLKKK